MAQDGHNVPSDRRIHGRAIFSSYLVPTRYKQRTILSYKIKICSYVGQWPSTFVRFSLPTVLLFISPFSSLPSSVPGASFQLFLGGPFFYNLQCHRTIEKLEKNNTLYVVI